MSVVGGQLVFSRLRAISTDNQTPVRACCRQVRTSVLEIVHTFDVHLFEENKVNTQLGIESQATAGASGSLRLTRRGRLVLFAFALLVVMGSVFFGSSAVAS